MTATEGDGIPVHQFLFGYEDGHRLLAGSRRLPDDAASQLLLLSDMASSVTIDATTGYLTAAPLPSAKAHVLLRTWPAPEMPRPGCVWSHALLIDHVDIAKINDFRQLCDLFARPQRNAIHRPYEQPLSLIDRPISPAVSLSRTTATEMVRALYASGSGHIGNRPGIEDAVLAIWSQQWPRLRRGFTFRTAPALDERTAQRFDLVVDAAPTLASDDLENSDWITLAVADLSECGGELRRFLWRYGSDLKHGRRQFRFLVELYLRTRAEHYSPEQINAILDTVSNALPTERDGGLLKEDLLAGSEYSQLPGFDPVDLLGYFLQRPRGEALRLSGAAAAQAVEQLWQRKPEQALAVLEAVDDAALAQVMFDQLLPKLSPEAFFHAARDRADLQYRVCARRPDLLDTAIIADIDATTRARLLPLVGDDADLAQRVIGHLLPVPDAEAARYFATRHYRAVVDTVFDRLAARLRGEEQRIAPVWFAAMHENIVNPSAERLLKQSSRLSQVGACAALLNWDLKAGLRVPPKNWAAVVQTADSDLRGAERIRVGAYLLTMALRKPARGCEPLFEYGFTEVHEALAASRLPYDEYAWLSPELPNLFWWDQWDSCLRLRMAVAYAYVSARLDVESLLRLSPDPSVIRELISVAARSSDGARYLKAHLGGR